MAWNKRKGSELSVFKGREASLNRAILQILAMQGPLKKYGIHRTLIKQRKLKKKHYGNVSKRVRALQQSGFLNGISLQTVEAGSEAVVYELSPKAYLALLFDSLSLEIVIDRLEDQFATEVLAAILASEPLDLDSAKTGSCRKLKS